MKILHIIPSLEKGGAEKITLEICKKLSKIHKIKLVVLSANNSLESFDFDIIHCTSFVHSSIKSKWEINLKHWNSIINEFKPDIIHSHLFKAEIFSRTQINTDIHYISHIHSPVPQLRNFSIKTLLNKRLLTDWYEKKILVKQYKKCNNNFIAVSSFCYNYLEKTIGLKNKNIIILKNAIELSDFKAVNRSPSLNDLRLISIGALNKNKNQLFILEVVSILKENGLNVSLALLGDGPERKSLELKSHELGIIDNVIFYGEVANVANYLSQSHIYVHSAKYEGLGISHIEAMASGLPIVALNAGGNAELIEDGNTGYLIDSCNVLIFANKIMELATNINIYQKMSSNAVLKAADFDLNIYIDQLNNFYESLYNWQKS
jgi:glycosyltransferase involved in cell wall biosynthesis